MAHLIDKYPLVAEIERQQRKLCVLSLSNEVEVRKEAAIQNGVYSSFLSFIDTLEVKEVDLEKEIEEHVVDMPMSEFTHESEVDDFWDWARKEFRHFFELGLKAKQG